MPSRVLLTIASSDEETMAASRADSRAAAEYRSVISSHGIGASPLHLRYLLSAVADIDAKFLAARLIRREPAACTGMSINTRRQGRSPLFRDSIRSDLGQRLSKSAEIVEIGENISQERLKHHGSPNGGLIPGLPEPVSQASDVVAAFVGLFLTPGPSLSSAL